MQYQNLRSTKLNGVFVCLKRVNEKEVMVMPKTHRIASIGLEVSNVESLKTDTLRMSAETLNFWLCKFVQKVRVPYDLLRINNSVCCCCNTVFNYVIYSKVLYVNF